MGVSLKLGCRPSSSVCVKLVGRLYILQIFIVWNRCVRTITEKSSPPAKVDSVVMLRVLRG